MRENERLWAPWRMDFITGAESPEKPSQEQVPIAFGPDDDPGCFICQAKAANEDRERFVFFRSEHSLGILNRYPYNNGHLLIAPRRHLAKLHELTEPEQLDLNRQIAKYVARLEEEMNPAGFNIGINLGHAAGAGLPGHLHWHIVPRWIGDTNFMTAVGSTKVIPQSLQTLWELLSK